MVLGGRGVLTLQPESSENFEHGNRMMLHAAFPSFLGDVPTVTARGR